MSGQLRTPKDFERPDAWRPFEREVLGPATVTGGEWLDDDYDGHAVIYLRLDPDARTVRVKDYDSGEFALVKRDEVALHAIHQVLERELRDARLEVGARISVLYRGQVKGEERSYHAYTVRREDGDGGLDFARLRPAGEPPKLGFGPPTSDVPADTRGLIEPLPSQRRDDAVDSTADEDIPF